MSASLSAHTGIISDRRGFRNTLKRDKVSSKIKAAEFLDKALYHESNGDFEKALSCYEDAAENLPQNDQLTAKITSIKRTLDENFEGVAHKRVRKSNDMVQAVRDIVTKYARDDEVDAIHDQHPTDDMQYDNDFSVESSVYPREVMIENLQQKTQAALQYQLLDRLNNGDYEELRQLAMIGKVRAQYILEMREEWNVKSDDPCFSSLNQLEEIGMKPKDCQHFLKRNAVFLIGLK